MSIKRFMTWVKNPFGRSPEKVEKEQRLSSASKGSDRASAAEKQAASRPKGAKEKRHFNVGIDFGTSGTKVVYRDQVGNKAWVHSFDHELKEYPPIVLPSTIRVVAGTMLLGAEAEKETTGMAFRSFKICMACQCGSFKDTDCNLHYDQKYHSRSDKAFRVPFGNGQTARVTPLMLGAFYLAYVIKTVRDHIKKEFEHDYDLQLTYNMCIPLDYLEEHSTKQDFLRTLFFAEKLADYIDNKCEIGYAMERYTEIDRAYAEIPSQEERNTFAQPESLSAVMSYATSRIADEGLYAIIDVGAGTSDCSVFRLVDHGGRKLVVYSANTYPIGCDAVDNNILNWLISEGYLSDGQGVNLKNTLLHRVRGLKERVSGQPIRIKTPNGTASIDEETFGSLAEPVGDDIFKAYRKTGKIAYEKEKWADRWKENSLFLIGGGTQIPVIRKKLQEKPADIVKTIHHRHLEVPEDLWAPKGLNHLIGDHFYLLAVAYGLSYHPAAWPEVHPPTDVGPMDASPPTKEIPDHEEVYFEP